MTLAPNHPVREFMSMPIDPETEPRHMRALELSAKSHTALHEAGYSTIDELLELSEDDLLEIPGLTVRGTQEVLRRLLPYREGKFDITLRPSAGEGFVPDDEDLELPPEGETPTSVDQAWGPVSYHDVVEDFYEVCETGAVRRIDTGTVLKPYRAGHQWYVGLRHAKKPDQSKSVRIDQLVLETFKGRSKTKKPLHVDDDPENCRLSNLVWASPDHPNFKDQRTKNAKRAAATRAVSSSGVKPKKGRPPITPVPMGEVAVEHTYRCGNIAMTVNDSNLGNWPTGLSTPQDRADALKVLQQINEMDRLVGLI